MLEIASFPNIKNDIIFGFQQDAVICNYDGEGQVLLANYREKIDVIQTLRIRKYHMGTRIILKSNFQGRRGKN